MKNKLFFTTILTLLSLNSFAIGINPIPEKPIIKNKPPEGIYNSAGISRNIGHNFIVDPEITEREYINGTLVRYQWKDINPAPSVFNFDIIEQELNLAQQTNSKVNLAILDSFSMPDWVLNSCENFDFSFRRQPQTTCLPWDSNYKNAKNSFIQELGQRFDGHPALSSVYFSYSAMTNGIEMHWRVNKRQFENAGYTPTRLADSYNDIMDMYASAFHSTPIAMEVHTVFNSDSLAHSAYNHCSSKLGKRCGVAIWWCASRMALNPNQSEFSVYDVAQKAANESFAICQSIGSFTTSPERFDNGAGWTTEEAFTHEMNFFLNEGFRNFELWTRDINNPNIQELINEIVIPFLECNDCNSI